MMNHEGGSLPPTSSPALRSMRPHHDVSASPSAWASGTPLYRGSTPVPPHIVLLLLVLLLCGCTKGGAGSMTDSAADILGYAARESAANDAVL